MPYHGIIRPLTVRIKWSGCGRARPNDGHHSHSKSNRPDTIIYMTFAHRQSRKIFTEPDVWSSPISPYGGRIVVGVTPSTFWMARRVQPSSATICSFVRDVKG